MAVNITFIAVNVNAMNRGCSVTIGETVQSGWTQNGKTNFANGQIIGSNLESGFVNNLEDNDFIDSPIGEIHPVSTAQNQTF